MTMLEWFREVKARPEIKRIIPLGLVFLSGLGFSIQSLTIKKLEEDTNYSASFQLIFVRGISQLVVSSYFIYTNASQPEALANPFGSTPYVKKIMAIRSVVGYGGICFAFLAIEALPLGDATVLVMLSPLFASTFSFLLMGEAMGRAELGAIVISLFGVVLISKPSFLFDEEQSLPFAGVVFGMLASVCAGGAYTCIRLLGTVAKMPWANVCLAQSFGQIILSMPCAWIAGQQVTWSGLTGEQWAGILGAGFLGCWSQIAMTVGMQKEKSATATGMRMSDVFFGFIWQVLFTNDKVLNMVSMLGACMVVSSIFLLVFNKSSSPLPPTLGTGEADMEMATTSSPDHVHVKKEGGDVYSALRNELSESEHYAEEDSVSLRRRLDSEERRRDGGGGRGEEASERDEGKEEEGLTSAQKQSSHAPDIFMKRDVYLTLAEQFGEDGAAGDLSAADSAWGNAAEQDEDRWDVDFDALKKEFDV